MIPKLSFTIPILQILLLLSYDYADVNVHFCIRLKFQPLYASSNNFTCRHYTDVVGSLETTFAEYDALVVGTPTYNTDADRMRTATSWDGGE